VNSNIKTQNFHVINHFINTTARIISFEISATDVSEEKWMEAVWIFGWSD
jgi:hypothetical protein